MIGKTMSMLSAIFMSCCATVAYAQSAESSKVFIHWEVKNLSGTWMSIRIGTKNGVTVYEYEDREYNYPVEVKTSVEFQGQLSTSVDQGKLIVRGGHMIVKHTEGIVNLYQRPQGRISNIPTESKWIGVAPISANAYNTWKIRAQEGSHIELLGSEDYNGPLYLSKGFEGRIDLVESKTSPIIFGIAYRAEGEGVLILTSDRVSVLPKTQEAIKVREIYATDKWLNIDKAYWEKEYNRRGEEILGKSLLYIERQGILCVGREPAPEGIIVYPADKGRKDFYAFNSAALKGADPMIPLAYSVALEKSRVFPSGGHRQILIITIIIGILFVILAFIGVLLVHHSRKKKKGRLE